MKGRLGGEEEDAGEGMRQKAVEKSEYSYCISCHIDSNR